MARQRHPLEIAYQLSAHELLDALARRFRARVALEGAVAEVHMAKHLNELEEKGLLLRFDEHDLDGFADFTLHLPGGRSALLEVKNVRKAERIVRGIGQTGIYSVETQKTRAAIGDPTSRCYGFDQFDILAVCLGKKTGNWRQFVFILSSDLHPHSAFPHKMATIQTLPAIEDGGDVQRPWHSSLTSLLGALETRP